MIMAEEKKEKPKERKAKPNEEKKPEAHVPKPADKPAQAPKPVEAKPHAAVQAESKPHTAPAEAKPAVEKKAEQKPEAKPGKKSRKPRKKAGRVELARGKRKTSVARASVKEGSGRLRVNSLLSGAIHNRFIRELIEEPLRLAGPDGNKVDVSVSMHGGGEMGQAQAARTAIARALSQYFGEGLKTTYEGMDKYLLCEDPRRVEPKKYKGRKARARFQKSYR
jgi:small subunit ribosomal protein S9